MKEFKVSVYYYVRSVKDGEAFGWDFEHGRRQEWLYVAESKAEIYDRLNHIQMMEIAYFHNVTIEEI